MTKFHDHISCNMLYGMSPKVAVLLIYLLHHMTLTVITYLIQHVSTRLMS